WQARENSPNWRRRKPLEKTGLLGRLQNKRPRELAEKLGADLGLSEEEKIALFKTEPFSRQTVYTRDYAAIPALLKALFRMVPDLIFAPRTREQLCKFMGSASRIPVNIAPRGRGTWALGGALLTKGGVILEMASFKKEIKVDEGRSCITVSASVDFQEAEEALNDHGLTLAARPSNKYGVISGFLSVGEPLKGGLGLNAFGSGHISESVEALRVVTAAGEERLIKKGDPDFGCFFGTNGRNGIITEVTLRALPKPARHYPLALHFVDSRNAWQFLCSLQQDWDDGKLSCRPMHIEFFGKAYLDEINRAKLSEQRSDAQDLISTEQIKRKTPAKDTILFVFCDQKDLQAFSSFVNSKNGYGIASQREAEMLWEERFSPMKLRKQGDLLTAEVILPLTEVQGYLSEITELSDRLGVKILPVAYILNSKEALVLPQFLTDHRLRFQYYRHFSLIPVLAHRAIKRFQGRPYGYGIWFAGLFRLALGSKTIDRLQQAKMRFDPAGILNPGKLYEIRSRFRNFFGNVLLHEKAIGVLEFALTIQTKLRKVPFIGRTLLSTHEIPYDRSKGDALHRCIKCSACMICPLAQIWERSGDPKLMSDAIYITPRFKMEYMQRYLHEGQKLSQEDVDRFVLCFRCGVAERETVCPISDLLLSVDESETTPCQKKLPTYDEFEERLRKDGYDVDGAIARYMDVLKTHPGVARAMSEVLGAARVQKSGEFSVLQPKTDFAIYKVEVDQDRCINCGKCGDEHTTSQRGFWDPRNPRKMVSLDDLLDELAGKLPKSWFTDAGGPIPAKLKTQGRSNGEVVYFDQGSRLDTGHQHCNGCLYCVMECPVDAIRVGLNDYYAELAGLDFTREDIRRINEEARTGGVPTSGTGSTGLFGGKGFDRYMFDFSVIVRPTRDGIREAIDIGVNLGRKPLFHLFEKANHSEIPKIKSEFRTLDLPTPILLELPSFSTRKETGDLVQIFSACARFENTIVLMKFSEYVKYFESIQKFSNNIALRLYPDQIASFKERFLTVPTKDSFHDRIKKIPLVEIVQDGARLQTNFDTQISDIFGDDTIISQLLICQEGSNPEQIAGRVVELAKSGAGVINLKTAFNVTKGYYESADLLPVCYEQLLAHSLHTQVSLIANGVKSPADLGISLMLGASAVVLDRTPLVALNYEYPMLEKMGESQPEIEVAEGVRKLQNLLKSWHKQIREVLGAFGVRDIRRTVGENGRLIDLRERERKMRTIVEDQKLHDMAIQTNREKIAEDGKLAKSASWKYSELGRLIKSVPPPNANLLGERKRSLESMLAARGDRRWNADMLTATWMMASGDIPSHKVPQTGGDFGGGSFDLMTFAPVKVNGKLTSLQSAVEEIDARISSGDRKMIAALDSISISTGVANKHRQPDAAPYVNHFPIDGADMSLGSIGWKLTLARYLAGATLKRFTGTG
ncbi:MAG: FAD-binding protein, partial [bacterium]